MARHLGQDGVVDPRLLSSEILLDGFPDGVFDSFEIRGVRCLFAHGCILAADRPLTRALRDLWDDRSDPPDLSDPLLKEPASISYRICLIIVAIPSKYPDQNPPFQ